MKDTQTRSHSHSHTEGQLGVLKSLHVHVFETREGPANSTQKVPQAGNSNPQSSQCPIIIGVCQPALICPGLKKLEVNQFANKTWFAYVYVCIYSTGALNFQLISVLHCYPSLILQHQLRLCVLLETFKFFLKYVIVYWEAEHKENMIN